jgi:hypothetical protein
LISTIFYLERKEEDLEGIKASLSYLDCHQFIAECLEKGKKETLRSWELMGKLPYGIFEQVALLEIEEDLERDFEKMEELINEDLFEIEMDARHLIKREVDSKKWVHPPLAMNQKLISGVIKRVSKTKYYAFHHHSFENIVKIWPEILIYKMIFPEAKEVIFIKDQKVFDISGLSAKSLLDEYLAYFEVYQHKPSWLVPKWAKKAFSQEDLFSYALKESGDASSFFTDEYSNWFFGYFHESRNQRKGEEEQKALQDLLPGMKEYMDANL